MASTAKFAEVAALAGDPAREAYFRTFRYAGALAFLLVPSPATGVTEAKAATMAEAAVALSRLTEAGPAQAAAQPDEPLLIVGTKRYSLLFYGEPEAVFVSDRLHITQLALQGPAALSLTPASRSVRLLGDRRDLEGLALPPQGIERLSRSGELSLWRVPRRDLLP